MSFLHYTLGKTFHHTVIILCVGSDIDLSDHEDITEAPDALQPLSPNSKHMHIPFPTMLHVTKVQSLPGNTIYSFLLHLLTLS